MYYDLYFYWYYNNYLDYEYELVMVIKLANRYTDLVLLVMLTILYPYDVTGLFSMFRYVKIVKNEYRLCNRIVKI